MDKLLKIVGIIVCLIPMIGFGLCGVFGVGMGMKGLGQSTATDIHLSIFIILLGLAGIGTSACFIWLIRNLWKSTNPPN